MGNKKHYIVTAITLGLIAASSAGLIGLANLITRDRIAQNEIDKVNAGIKEIFGDNASIFEEKTQKEAGFAGDYKYLSSYYIVNNGDDAAGIAFRTNGSNMYGKISLLIGYSGATHNLMGFTVVVNEQTYATTLEENYIVPVNEGKRDYEDVSCGATYGAKLIRDMVNEAEQAANEIWN